jgi:hypothetical protein
MKRKQKLERFEISANVPKGKKKVTICSTYIILEDEGSIFSRTFSNPTSIFF